MLERAAARITPGTIIDVGASDGCWSIMAHRVWPAAKLLLIEANPVYAEARARMLAGIEHRFVEALACADDGASLVRFSADNPLQGVYDAESEAGASMVKRVTIDELMECDLPAPYLIKLDTHGREHEILRGARETLRQTCALIIEVYTWSLGDNSLRAVELLPLIEREHDFLPADFCDPMYRPFDGRVGQVDCLFEPRSAEGMNTSRWA